VMKFQIQTLESDVNYLKDKIKSLE
jgi:hypothetical protein